MSFVDTVKYVRQLSIVDEFGGRGDANNIRQFYIVFRATDDDGNDLQVSAEDVDAALLKVNPDILLTNYIGNDDWGIAVLSNDNTHNFYLGGVAFKNGFNIITVNVKETFTGNHAICVKFLQDETDTEGNTTKVELVSSTYLSDFPSTFYISR